ncbi:hypothetical protein GGC47_003965 [Bosea sp. OAE752]|uniref:hypothetical protein n=1 Tax=Bosea sp. OAE752 TaxID=2663873 RepID=UPI003D2433CD
MSRPHLYIVPNEQPVAPRAEPEKAEKSAGEVRLTARGDRQKIDATSIPKGWQLPLPFDDKPLGPTVLIVSMESMNGPTLRNLISERKPASAVDLRQLIRFDLPGTSREDVFRILNVNRTYYVKDSLPWHRLDARALATLDAPVSNVLLHEIADRRADCIFVFVYRHEEARSIASHLTKVLGPRMEGPWRIEEAS